MQAAVRQRAEEAQTAREAELAGKEAAAREALRDAAQQKMREEEARHHRLAAREAAAAAGLQRKVCWKQRPRDKRRLAALSNARHHTRRFCNLDSFLALELFLATVLHQP